ncbi:MAG: threonylcarbamoyl-AMP synthase [Erysipelothrix sp.]|nr:threonylcarbamoyl-AMP synthase [Erysipelothrix sp.]
MDTLKYRKDDLNELVEILKDDGMVAIPTDTVYGLAIKASNSENYASLVKAKGRPENKPFPLMVSSYEQIEELVELDSRARNLMHKFMPGAVTFIFNRKESAFEFLGEQKTLGIRMADDPWVLSLIDQLESPIWLPSANVSGMETAISSDMVKEQLNGRIKAYVEGVCQGGRSSSVFDLTQKNIVCLREGDITLNDILEGEKQ